MELPVRLAVEYPVRPADDALEEAVLAWPSDQPVEAPSLEEVVGAEAVAPPLDEVVGAEAVVLLAVVLLAHNRCRSQGHGYRRCFAATAAGITTRLVATATAGLPLPALLTFIRATVGGGSLSLEIMRAVFLSARIVSCPSGRWT